MLPIYGYVFLLSLGQSLATYLLDTTKLQVLGVFPPCQHYYTPKEVHIVFINQSVNLFLVVKMRCFILAMLPLFPVSCLCEYSAPGVNVIPGRNCGVSRPYRRVDVMPESPQDWQCLIIENSELYRASYKNNVPGVQLLSSDFTTIVGTMDGRTVAPFSL